MIARVENDLSTTRVFFIYSFISFPFVFRGAFCRFFCGVSRAVRRGPLWWGRVMATRRKQDVQDTFEWLVDYMSDRNQVGNALNDLLMSNDQQPRTEPLPCSPHRRVVGPNLTLLLLFGCAVWRVPDTVRVIEESSFMEEPSRISAQEDSRPLDRSNIPPSGNQDHGNGVNLSPPVANKYSLEGDSEQPAAMIVNGVSILSEMVRRATRSFPCLSISVP